MLEVEAVAATDLPALEALRGLLAAYDEGLPDTLRVRDLASEQRIVERKYASGAILLARLDGAAVGCVIVNRIDAATAEIKRLYVEPRARRSGAGRALMDAGIALARRCGYSRVVLDTHRECLAPAYALYVELGFVECDAYSEPEYACPTYMELRLE